MKKGKFIWVLEIIENYEDEDILNDFLSEFKEGEDIEEEKYFEFCTKYVDDMSEMFYIRKNWEYIMSEGDESVYDEE